ncbi:M48 family metallopeptidase [Rhizobium paknamense]|uniref:Metal-dependent hydrolase n=1 Tax=Rhizobium paknamense TaxID=1206817 RepID=A0ABU0IIF3_9HYPH|nr:M48 family metallopeptidase [Rhizobium paknamense]MDQ0457961.1 putative metal-dependent hydrolase [Rhizobium paknamense]
MFPLFLQRPARQPKPPANRRERMLEVAGRSVPVVIRENPRATRLTLRIEPGGRALRMTIPKGVREADISDFLTRHHGWIATKLARYEQDQSLKAGGTLLLRGVPHRIVHTGQLRGVTEAMVIDGEPVIRVSGLEDHLGRRLAAFLKKEAKADLERLVAIHTGRLGKAAKTLTMKDTRSRWGSCSWEGNLSFSWRIVMAPPAVIDYLAAHEVAHLKQMNHSAEFWSLCRSLCPGMDEAKAWLKRHGAELHAIEFG